MENTPHHQHSDPQRPAQNRAMAVVLAIVGILVALGVMWVIWAILT